MLCTGGAHCEGYKHPPFCVCAYFVRPYRWSVGCTSCSTVVFHSSNGLRFTSAGRLPASSRRSHGTHRHCLDNPRSQPSHRRLPKPVQEMASKRLFWGVHLRPGRLRPGLHCLILVLPWSMVNTTFVGKIENKVRERECVYLAKYIFFSFVLSVGNRPSGNQWVRPRHFAASMLVLSPKSRLLRFRGERVIAGYAYLGQNV